MTKYCTLCLLVFLMATQKITAQLDLAFISNFTNTTKNSINHLSWTVGNNRAANNFYLERCTNGKDFKAIASVKATATFATESYNYADTITSPDKIMYRLKVVTKTQHSFYSKIVVTQSKIATINEVRIIGNPVQDKLSFLYTSKNAQQADIKVYNLSGKIVLSRKIDGFNGNNPITISLNSDFAPGIYVIEINDNVLSQTSTFIKL